jgi:rubredoxin
MEIIRLTTFNDSMEAHLFQNLLENEEIESFITNENFNNLLPGHTKLMNSGVQVMIHEKDIEKATKILDQFLKKNEIHCPKCDSNNIVEKISKISIPKIITIVLSIFAGTPFNNINNSYHCNDCGQDFN